MLPNLLSAVTEFKYYNYVFDGIIIFFTIIYLIVGFRRGMLRTFWYFIFDVITIVAIFCIVRFACPLFIDKIPVVLVNTISNVGTAFMLTTLYRFILKVLVIILSYLIIRFGIFGTILRKMKEKDLIHARKKNFFGRIVSAILTAGVAFTLSSGAIVSTRKMTQYTLFRNYDSEMNETFVAKYGDKYIVSPYSLTVSDENYYLITYKEKYDSYTHYRVDKMEMIEKPREKIKPTFRFNEARTPSRFIVEAKDLVLGYDTPLTRPVTFNLERGQKIAIRGVNGLGKTTLLKTILGLIPPVSGKVELGEFLQPGYFEQEEREKNEKTALEDVWDEYPGLTNYEVRAALAGCGLTNEHITSKVFVLSGGEAAKVRLCKLMLKDINWLVLDEPTNHLDVDAKEELQRAIKAFKGSVLLVSHEPEFYEGWIDKVWNIEDWTTKII